MGIPNSRAPLRRPRRRAPRQAASSSSSARTPRLLAVIVGTVLLLALSASLSPSPFLGFVGVAAEEIVATDSWTELGPNDTIPAGLHVKIDMSTGRKFVKTLDDEEMTDFDKKRLGVPVDVEIDADGTATVVESVVSKGVAVVASSSESDSEEGESAQGGGGKKKKSKKDSYDYDMMHRTLSHLPPDEMAKYGGLPALPAAEPGASAKATPEQREHFEAKMREIWVQRQALLQKFQEENIADVPDILRGRLRLIAEYMDDPVAKRAEMESANNADGGAGGSIDDDSEDTPATFVTNVPEALEDLEYQLSDVDVARDFHTLGGWSLTVALLSDAVHCPPAAAGPVGDDAANETVVAMAAAREECLAELSSSATRDAVDKIQTLAAWAAGTAVKNHGEFSEWALEDVSGLVSPPPSSSSGEDSEPRPPVTVVSLLLSDFLACDDDNPAATVSAARKARRQKGLYALGALLRGNPGAQAHFASLGGPVILADALVGSLDTGDVRFASRVLALGCDLLTDARNPQSSEGEEEGKEGEGGAVPSASGEESQRMVEALTAASWCSAAVRLSSPGTAGVSIQVRERALEATTVLAETGRCGYGESERGVVVQSRTEWMDGSANEDDDRYLDPSYRNDLVAVADAALEAMRGGGSADGATEGR